MSSSGFKRPTANWQWPDDLSRPANNESRQRATGADASSSSPTDRSSHPTQDSSSSPRTEPPPKPRRHWKPRTCRICFDTVHPTFHEPSGSLPGIFQSEPTVTYDSPDGRLLRPCKCKGSSKYVHENCLQQWRHADPSYGQRNYWQCPTCGFRYRLQRLSAARFISSAVAQVVLTTVVLILLMFVLGFIADPIISIYLDPWGTLSDGFSRSKPDWGVIEEPSTWSEHFIKGMASLGLLGFVKVFLSSPFNWINIRIGGRARQNTGRDRLANLSWITIMIGIATVLYGVWRAVRTFSRRTLEKAGERVMDVQGDDGGDDDQDAPTEPTG